MQKQKSDVTRRAWNLLRVALLWVRKGGVFKSRLMMDLRLFPKFLKTIGPSTAERSAIHYYGERELSFDKTPVVHVRMNRTASMRFRMPRIPCINPRRDLDCNSRFDDEEDVISCSNVDGARMCFLTGGEDEYENGCEVYEETISGEEEGIDLKAEQFIAKFYEQMKLQRQISYLRYNEITNKSAS